MLYEVLGRGARFLLRPPSLPALVSWDGRPSMSVLIVNALSFGDLASTGLLDADFAAAGFLNQEVIGVDGKYEARLAGEVKERPAAEIGCRSSGAAGLCKSEEIVVVIFGRVGSIPGFDIFGGVEFAFNISECESESICGGGFGGCCEAMVTLFGIENGRQKWLVAGLEWFVVCSFVPGG